MAGAAGADLVAKTERPDPELSKFHGLARSLMANAVRGVTEGFKKELDIVGVGYRAEVRGKQVVFAHDTPNFIANRIGVAIMFNAANLMLEQGLSIEEVDALTGPAILFRLPR